MSKAEDLAKEFLKKLVSHATLYKGTIDELEVYEPDDVIWAYKEGYRQAEKDFLDNIWHSPDEEPEIDRKIIWESENFLGKHLDKEWKPKIDCFGRKEKWCYLADILPSRNWTRERPYSKVDYSRGYDNGYEQAEKDLMLTIEDINDIIRIYEGVLDEIESCENIYTEVLNRFKDFKERKEK